MELSHKKMVIQRQSKNSHKLPRLWSVQFIFISDSYIIFIFALCTEKRTLTTRKILHCSVQQVFVYKINVAIMFIVKLANITLLVS